jgi:hypothetical protein
MKQNKNNESTNTEQMFEATSDQMTQDFKNAVLIVSIVANLTVFTAWVTVLVA